MAKKNKKPQARIEPSPKKQPKTASNPTSYHNLRPSWRISKIEMTGLYGWRDIDAEKLRYIHNKLSNFESMTWNDILVKNKKNNHSVEIEKLSSTAKTRLTEIQLEDIDELISLRLSGKERVWGILEQGVLIVLWWDPDHQVCPSNLKHT